MAYSEKIPFETLPNTRDLSGFPVSGGKVKPHRLIRSGMLEKGTEADIRRLVSEFELCAVIDFRTPTECREHPDPLPVGVEQIFLPILSEAAVGITHEDGHKRTLQEQIDDLKTKRITPVQDMARLYHNIINSEFAQAQYSRFYDMLCKERKGSVLWHCTAGKDRVGIGTLMLLLALGASSDDAYEDYLATQRNYQAEIDQLRVDILRKTGSRDAVEFIDAMVSVHPEYMESALSAMIALCGSVDAYMTEKIDLTEEKRAQLRAMYVE